MGLVITDGLMMGAITNHFEPGIIELKAFLAGNDILLCPTDVARAIDLIEQAINQETISEQELNRRVLKVLKAKESVGLSQKNFIQQPLLSTPEAIELKKNLYEHAITVLGNNHILATSPRTPVIQIGGEKGPFAEAFEKVYYRTSHEDTYDELLCSLQEEQEIIVGLFGMSRNARDNYGITQNTLALIKELKKKHKVIITIFGNPYSLRNFDDTSAIVVAYEDDPDAQYAAAHVILGELEAKGKLPIARR